MKFIVFMFSIIFLIGCSQKLSEGSSVNTNISPNLQYKSNLPKPPAAGAYNKGAQ